jgi:hypothetical protein
MGRMPMPWHSSQGRRRWNIRQAMRFQLDLEESYGLARPVLVTALDFASNHAIVVPPTQG